MLPPFGVSRFFQCFLSILHLSSSWPLTKPKDKIDYVPPTTITHWLKAPWVVKRLVTPAVSIVYELNTVRRLCNLSLALSVLTLLAIWLQLWQEREHLDWPKLRLMCHESWWKAVLLLRGCSTAQKARPWGWPFRGFPCLVVQYCK